MGHTANKTPDMNPGNNPLNMLAIMKTTSGIFNLIIPYIDPKEVELVETEAGKNTFRYLGNLSDELPLHVLQWTELADFTIVNSVQECRTIGRTCSHRLCVTAGAQKSKDMRVIVTKAMKLFEQKPTLAEGIGMNLGSIITVEHTPHTSTWILVKKTNNDSFSSLKADSMDRTRKWVMSKPLS